MNTNKFVTYVHKASCHWDIVINGYVGRFQVVMLQIAFSRRFILDQGNQKV